jgi:hypothetical protein
MIPYTIAIMAQNSPIKRTISLGGDQEIVKKFSIFQAVKRYGPKFPTRKGITRIKM